ncbi:methylenetetrahydrofolate reductase [Frigoribacterium sp. VKM Ac-1396]|uniref:methylenetetrahydrofolate reductase n=1 Tax=Frigoribacterium sp. VKM Ac-1396 TaxID=2783821 RepID=UPI00188A9AD9|nr:methylenetetrahydrofolate reductase [Frigoribacterium sp. VKM Ac-1396]MBF4601054.1 methylenetetrahydrofolate reductase [Frigoribacterium sp. VKM Ac-1396]
MPTFSFEMYPPRTPASADALHASLRQLASTGPEFISVTYGASGSSRAESLAVLTEVLRDTDVQAMAHLTCVGSSYAEASRLIREFLDAGVTAFLALRGDPPAGLTEDDVFLGDLGSAGELVQLIHRVQAERVPFVENAVPGNPFASRLSSGPKTTVAVAAFPNGHPRSRSSRQDIDTLLAKQAAGATLAITQLFFEADDYLGFVDRAREAGVTMRILPGLMPILGASQLRRIVELTGETLPADLLRRLETADQPTVVGVDHAVHLGRRLLAGGAPGLHLYTFNRHEAPLAVLRGCGLLDHCVPSTPVQTACVPSTPAPTTPVSTLPQATPVLETASPPSS